MKYSKYILFSLLISAVCIGGYLYATNNDTQLGVISPIGVQTTLETPMSSKECPLTLISWNLGNFGKKKTSQSIELMAEILKGADIVTIQEVTAGGQFGAQAVAKLIDTLSRKGSNWDYILSDPAAIGTPDVERAAILFKESKIATNRRNAHLIRENWSVSYGREPYASIFEMGQSYKVHVATLHAPPTAKHPLITANALTSLPELKEAEHAIFTGDFNLGKNSTDSVFEKIGYIGHIHEPTSLKNKVTDGKYRVKQYDNIYTKGITVCSSGVIDFVEKLYSPITDESLKRAREVSDHLPVYITFK